MSKQLSLSERIVIERMLAQNYTFATIARKLERSASTIAREVKNYRCFINPDSHSLSFMPPKSCIIKIALTNDDMIHYRNSCQHAELLHTIGNSDILSGWLQTATWMIVCVIRIMPL